MSFKGARSQRQESQRALERIEKSKGMVLPFRPLNIAFSHMYYSVDLPSVSALPPVSETPLLQGCLEYSGQLVSPAGPCYCP